MGAIFRTADGAGVKKIFLTGYTAEPVDVLGRVKKEIAKTALGAEKTIAWEKHQNITTLLKKLKNNYRHSVSIVGVEKDVKGIEATNYKKLKLEYPVAFVFGNEVKGLSKKVLERCDDIIEIPMRGKKKSLNVSVVVGVILFHFV